MQTGLRDWGYRSKEGEESMRLAREQLKLGDVIRYAYEESLFLLIAIEPRYFTFHRLAFRNHAEKRVALFLHAEWELLGHMDDWQQFAGPE